MKLQVDSRGIGESKIFSLVGELLTNSPYAVEKVALDVGDYCILNDAGDPCVLVERKTHADMATSLQSKNHMKEQVYRIRAFHAKHPNAAVFIVYEGCMGANWYDKTTGSLPNKNVDMFLTCVACRDGVTVHHTVNETHTANWLVAMMKKETKGELRATKEEPNGEVGYLQTLALSKTGNCTSKNQWTRMLMAIDGVSAERAVAITKAYPTCSELVRSLKREHDATKEALENIQIKKRRLGPSVAKAIVDALQ
jgi:ERCC4-type nuclease